MIRVNVGCGPHPTPGWVNLDNSIAVLLARLPRHLTSFLARVGMLNSGQTGAIRAARRNGVRRGSATKLPFQDNSVDVLYSSHMLEHLDRSEARKFVSECHRVLIPGGLLRLAIPDLGLYVEAYQRSADADDFLERLRLARPQVRGMRRIAEMLVGFRGHRWMYDRGSVEKLVKHASFDDIEILEPGRTLIAEPGALNLREREGDSLYLEARRPKERFEVGLPRS